MLFGAGNLADDGQLASFRVDGRIVKTFAASDEAAVAAFVAAWPRIAVELARQHLETGAVGLGFDLDDLAAPAHALAARVLCGNLLGRDGGEIAAGNLRRNRGAAGEGQRGEYGNRVERAHGEIPGTTRKARRIGASLRCRR